MKLQLVEGPIPLATPVCWRTILIRHDNGKADFLYSHNDLVQFHESSEQPGRFWLSVRRDPLPDNASDRYEFAGRLDAPPECLAAWRAGEPWRPILDYLFEKYPAETAKFQELVVACLAPPLLGPSHLAIISS